MFDNKTTPQVQATITRINNQGLEAQRKLLMDHLQAGNTITFIEAMKMGINNLHSRIPELKAAGIPIYSRFVKVGRIDCKEYSLQPFDELPGK